MLGTIVNAATIIIGTMLGNSLKGRFSENIKQTVMHGLSLTVMLIGFSMAIGTENMLIVTLSMVIGGIIGELLKIEDRLNSFGRKLETRFSSEGETLQGPSSLRAWCTALAPWQYWVRYRAALKVTTAYYS